MPDPSRKFKVAQVLASRGQGGLESVPFLLAESLRRKGWEASVWCDPRSGLWAKAKGAGLPVQPFRFHGHLSLPSILRILGALKADAPDLLHLHKSKDLWSVVPALGLAGWRGPLFMTQHVENRVKKSDPLHTKLYRRVDLLTTCSRFIQENVLATCPIPPERVQPCFAPVDLGIFRFREEGRNSLRRLWGWESKFVIGLTSRISPGKDHELFLRIAQRLLEMDDRFRFRIAGSYTLDERWYFQDLLRLREHLGLEEKVIFEGFVPELTDFLSGLDLFVHTSQRESFGMAVIEALACGRPVVARAGGGVAETMTDAEGRVQGGRLLESSDPEVWAQSLGELCRDRDLLAKMGEEGPKMARRFELNSWVDDRIEQYLKFLR